MYYSSLRTEVDLAKVLLSAGWRPSEINGVLQFPLSEKSYQRLGAASLFFLIADEALATEIRPGAKQAATALLQRQGWLEVEIESLLKPTRFSPSVDYLEFDDDFETDLGRDLDGDFGRDFGRDFENPEGFISKVLASTAQPTRIAREQLEANYLRTANSSRTVCTQSFPRQSPPISIKRHRRSPTSRQYRYQMACNRLLGLALILTGLILFIYAL